MKEKNQLNDNLFIKMNEEQKRLLYEGKYLKDILKLNEEEFTLIKDRTNKLFVNIFGPDLSLKASFANASYEERLLFYKFVAKYEENKKILNCYFKNLTLSEITNIRNIYLKKYLDYYKEVWRNKTLCDLVNCPRGKLDGIINKLNKGKAYKLLLKAFGNELNNTCNINVLSNDELIDLEIILMWFRQKYYVKTELIHIDMDDMYIKFKNIARDKKYFYDYLDEAISLIPKHIIIIERLLNGIVNNKIYTINEIANMFCLSLIEINYILDQSNNLLSLLLKSYKEIYNVDIDVSKNNLLCRIK